jgi:predicted metal-dependent phosphoesterase TrpH
MPYADLHLHSYYSDGRPSPAEIVHRAAQLGLQALALTDHDSLAGVPEARALASAMHIELIPAVELTTRWDRCGESAHNQSMENDIDVLGYGMDCDNHHLMDFIAAAVTDIQARLADCCKRLSTSGYPISFSEVIAENPRAASAHHLIKVIGRKYLGGADLAATALFAAHWGEVRLSAHPIQQAITAIHAAGGLAVLAHPTAVHCDTGWLSAHRVGELVEAGLDGIEVYHPRLNQAARRHFIILAQQFNLLVTGGSDDHGWPSGFPHLGSQPVGEEIVARLREGRR